MVPSSASTSLLSRRTLLQSGLATASALAMGSPFVVAAERPQRTDQSLFKLSLAAYSFNRVLPRAWTAESKENAKFSLEQFIDFCAAQQLGGCELTAYYFPKDVTSEYLLGIKERCFRLGLSISGTAIGNNFCVASPEELEKQLQMTRDWIDYSAIMGAPVIRIFAGTVPKGETIEAARSRCVAAINEALKYAAKKGVCLALENHGGITATPEELLAIVSAVDPSPWFGVNFDSGNFRTSDPYADLARIAPYAINAQVKVEIAPDGKKQEADLPRILQILKDARYRGFVTLEYEAAEDPFVAVPKHLSELKSMFAAL
jgi:sugar phosphate isomerase/epimerase